MVTDTPCRRQHKWTGSFSSAAIVWFGSLAMISLIRTSASESNGGTPWRGIVADEDGRPAAGATVWLSLNHVDDGRPPLFDRTMTNERGEFTVMIPDSWVANQYSSSLALWAYRRGSRLASPAAINAATLQSANPVRLRLEPATPLLLRVLYPAGEPVAQARVAVTGAPIENFAMELPDEMSDQLAVETDEHGRADLATFGESSGVTVRLTTREFGTQWVYLRRESADDFVVKLRPTGRIIGQVLCDDPNAVAGVKVRVDTSPPEEPFGPGRVHGEAASVTDGDGRFEVAAIAEGRIGLVVLPIAERPHRSKGHDEFRLRAGETSEVQLRLERMVRLHGFVREFGTNDPIARAMIRLANGPYRTEATTDADGRYECYNFAGQLGVWFLNAPRPHLSISYPLGGRVTVPEDVEQFALPDIHVTRGRELAGTVVDNAGKPAAGATVRAVWTDAPRAVFAVSDATGRFTLSPVAPNADVMLDAELNGARTEKPIAAAPGELAVTLTVSHTNSAAVSGRVVDGAGKPVAGAAVQIWVQRPSPDAKNLQENIVLVNGRRMLRTDADGRFETPQSLDPNAQYRAVAKLDYQTFGKTEWLRPLKSEQARWSDLVVRRLRTVEGRVVDRRGQPIAGASVLCSGDAPRRTRTVSDGDGRFRLPDVFDGTAYLFADTPGFRFHGQPIGPLATVVDLILTRHDEPPVEQLSAQLGVLAHDEELALARTVLEPCVEQVLKSDADVEKSIVLSALAAIDLDRAQEYLEKQPFKQSSLRDRVQRAIALAMLAEHRAEALAIVESLVDPMERALGYLEVAERQESSERARELLQQAALHSRAIEAPAFRLYLLRRIIRRQLDLSFVEDAKPLVQVGHSLAKQIEPNRRAEFGVVLARLDFEAGLELVRGAEAPIRERCLGQLACEVATRDPDESDRLLQSMDARWREQWQPHVYARMAQIDLPRARVGADCMKQSDGQAFALGLMARSLAKSDPIAATNLLREAYDRLSRHAEVAIHRSEARVAAALLPITETIDTALVPEFFWWTLSLRDPQSRAMYEFRRDRDGALAASLARYHVGVARHVFAPVATELSEMVRDSSNDLDLADYFRQAIVIDPAWAAKLVGQVPREDDRLFDAGNLARLGVASILARTGEARWREANRRLLEEWALEPDTR